MSIPAFRSVSTATGSATNVVAALPSGSVAGDYLIAAIRNVAGTPAAITGVPTGWGSALQSAATSGTGDDVQLTLYAKVSTGEAGPFTWTLGANDNWTADIIAVTGHGIGQVSSIAADSTSGTAQVATGVTAPNAALLVGIWAYETDSGTSTEDMTTERSDANGMVVATEEVVAGATGTRTATTSNNKRSVSALLALTAAPGDDFLMGSM